jgi:predicted DsbA family dithiol-disulfide isomerase
VRIEELRKHFDVEIRWKAFPLHPETPEDGMALEELFAGRDFDIKKSQLRLKLAADELGLPLGPREEIYNTRLAQELAKWAELKGKGDLFHIAVFRAYFVDGKNIGKVNELIHIADSVGIPEQEARSVLGSRTYQGAVDEDWSRSYQLGITGVPTFVVDGQATVGFQPYEALEQFLKTCGVKKRRG